MQIVSSIAGMQRLTGRWRQERRRLGFVPTMGYLHEGHLSLVKRARQASGSRGKVVVSIYVNPTQFAPSEDLSRYPRDLERDLSLLRAAGADAVFTPDNRTMYPDNAGAAFSTYVVEEQLSQVMEGAARPAHFRGVTTVVAKLFHIVQPDVAVFGQKDFQQAARSWLCGAHAEKDYSWRLTLLRLKCPCSLWTSLGVQWTGCSVQGDS